MSAEVMFIDEAEVRYWIVIEIQDEPPIYEEVVMPKKTVTRTPDAQLPEAELWLVERRSPIPFNSFEAGCSIRITASSEKTLSSAIDQALEIAEDGLDRARAMLEMRLKADIDEADE